MARKRRVNDDALFIKLRILGLPVLACYGDGRVEFERRLEPNEARIYRDILARHIHRGPLTKEQHDVLLLVARGRANKEIAVELGLSVEMVQYHLRMARIVLGAVDRAQMVAIGFRCGILK